MSEINEELIRILDTLVMNTGSTSASLITEDGLLITSSTKKESGYRDEDSNFAGISASILSMAERGIEIINSNKILEQIKIDATLDESVEKDFTILITRVISNILLQIIFPKKINLGLIQFEANASIKEIKNLIKKDTARELFTSIGSLL